MKEQIRLGVWETNSSSVNTLIIMSAEEYKDFMISPAAMVFHYGQTMFEGMKAYKTPDGRVVLFRPQKNIERANNSNRRLCIPEIPAEDFLQAVIEVVKIDKDWIPESRKNAKIENGILVEDVICNSPSTAGWVVLGNANNGWLTWKTEDGKLIDKFRKK